MTLTRPFSIVLVSILLAGCSAEAYSGTEGAPGSAQESLTTSEGFESGSKTAYAAANVTLSSGSWNMNDALWDKAPPTSPPALVSSAW
jgi:endonuclease G